MFPIHAEIIPHKSQIYPTVGDYGTDKNGVKQFRVSDMQNEDFSFLVLIHELIEAYLCEKAGITDEEITAFDLRFEAEREVGLHTEDEEPGCDPDAPYHSQHMKAMKIERILARFCAVKWSVYDRKVMSL